MTERTPLFSRWMLWAFLTSLVCGVASGGLYYRYYVEYDREPPALDPCFRVIQKRLKVATLVAPSEPFTLSDGTTVYLSDTEFKTMTCSAKSRLGGDVNQRLARAFATEDPDQRAKAYADLIQELPNSAERDKEALALWRVLSGAVLALPESPARTEAAQAIDQTIGCRFNHPRLPDCPSRPPIPFLVWPLAGIAALALLALVLTLLARLVRRLRIRLATRASAG